jgi:DNA repair exonuclease SbcCD ATPase subunit
VELQYIPRTFWHSLSIAVLIVSSGLTYIAYNSSSVSIEIANAKINLSSEVASSTLALRAALDEAKKAKKETQKRYTTLLARHKALDRQAATIEGKAKTNASLRGFIDNFKNECPECIGVQPFPASLTFKGFDENILKAEGSLKKLEALNKQIQPMQ